LFTSDANNNLATNTTKDGQDFLSLSEPGTEYSNSSQLNLQFEGDTGSSNNNCGSIRAVRTKYKNLQSRGTTKVKKVIILLNNNINNNLASNSNDNEISEQISQRNNGEDSKKNSRVEQIASTLRDSYKANAKELKGSYIVNFKK
jgi:hypothetical protein